MGEFVDRNITLQYNVTTARVKERGNRTNEEDVSASPFTGQEKTRIPGSYEDQRRTRGSSPKTQEGSEAPHRMMETLARERDFSRLFKEGQRFVLGPLRLFLLRRETGPLRVCFVGRGKKAVCRNRTRRRLREAFRVHYYPLWKNRPCDLAFLGSEEIASWEFSCLVFLMGKLLERAEEEGEACERA